MNIRMVREHHSTHADYICSTIARLWDIEEIVAYLPKYNEGQFGKLSIYHTVMSAVVVITNIDNFVWLVSI